METFEKKTFTIRLFDFFVVVVIAAPSRHLMFRTLLTVYQKLI
jgi:hypothetical protein